MDRIIQEEEKKNRQLTAAVRQTGRERIFVSHFHVVVGKINANGKTLSCQSQCVCRSEERRGEEVGRTAHEGDRQKR